MHHVLRTKNQYAADSTNTDQHAKTSVKKNKFLDEKPNVQVLRREKSTCNKFHKKNRHAKSS